MILYKQYHLVYGYSQESLHICGKSVQCRRRGKRQRAAREERAAAAAAEEEEDS